MKNVSFLLLLIMIFAIPWENAVVLGAFGTIVRPLGMLAFVMTVFYVLKTGEYRPFNMIHYALLAFVVWSGMSILWTVDPDLTLIRIKTYAQLFIMVWLIWELVRTENQMRILIQVYIWGAWVSIYSTITNYMAHEQAAYGRYSAEGFDPNDLSVMLALGIPLAWYLFLKQKNFLLKWTNAAYIMLAMWTISLTASRTGFVVGVMALFYIVLTYRQLSGKMKVTMSLFLAIATFYGISSTPADSFKRIATIQQDMNDGSLNGRGVMWNAGLEVVNDQPIIGIGAGAYPAEMELLINARNLSHNTLLAVLAETGLIGLLLFLFVLFLFFYTASKTNYVESMLFLTLLAVWVLSTMFLTWEMRKPTWLLFALIALEYTKLYQPTLFYQRNRVQISKE
ncbi:O-antigen ligase family protein [Domibacillus iocasae]|uniref:O-antigen ligase-related domain-containing protein n=1 Tax=Domibacillus iocasae TaxID=1714016 RepID=A0A1E7DPG0_9BACI|nr:O-antigen ligase family protein [Domibacillus iocasae]OES44980.1 hypothetical protein BA724_06870 [Domibacillus iocasae]